MKGGTEGGRADSVRELGPRIWLVLGGGGLRGLAHLGAWQALTEAEVEIQGILGTSVGALVGACVAGGMGWEELAPLALALEREDLVRIRRRAAWVNGIRAESVLRGGPLRGYIEEVIPVDSWARLSLPLQVNAVNLGTGETTWFGTGARLDVPLAEVIYASSALPVLYPPARIGEEIYVDGGAGDALPLRRAEEMGATGILAVDVGSAPEEDASEVVSEGLVAIHQRVFSIQSGRRRREALEGWNGPPVVLIRPDVEGYGTFDFDAIQYFLEEGYRAARAALSGSGDGDPGK